MKKLLFLLAFLFISVTSSMSQYTYMVKDISVLDDASEPSGFTVSGGYMYFVADDGIVGKELWRSDGTNAGTALVKDIRPGTADAFHYFPTDNYLTDFNGILLFNATDAPAHEELWRSDGTDTGTYSLTPQTSMNLRDHAVIYNNNFYFASGNELWKTDGTIAGTVIVKDPIRTAGPTPGTDLTIFNNEIFFVGYDAATGYEVWKSDGTTAGTVLLKDINPGTGDGIGYGNFEIVNGTLYFTASDGVNGYELWKSDGTAAGTSMLKDINPTGPSSPSDFISFNGAIYFLAAPGSFAYRELWKTDGTIAGTVAVIDSTNLLSTQHLCSLKVFSNALYFVADATAPISQLWKTDGTLAGTQLVLQGNSNGYVGFNSPTILNNNLYFGYIDLAANATLSMLDSAGNLQQIIDIVPGIHDDINQITEMNGNLYFSAKGLYASTEFWKSDGTTAGTFMIKNINTHGSSEVQQLEDLNGTLMFSANDAIHGSELWRSNGNTYGTQMVVDANPTGNSAPYSLEFFKNEIYYRDYAGTSNLWRSKGTMATTAPFGVSMINVNMLKEVDNKLYIMDSQGFWRSDGTVAGTINIISNNINDVAKAGNYVCALSFNALYSIDSLNAYSVLQSGSTIMNLQSLGDSLYYALNKTTMDTLWIDSINYIMQPVTHKQLWMTNGTAAGTSLVADSISIDDMVVIGNNLYIGGSRDNIYGVYTYNYSTGLVLVKSISATGAVHFSNFTNAGGTLFFSADDPVYGEEPWRSDGTDAGTELIRDINPTGNSSPNELTFKNGLVYFSADDGVHGRELWQSDGTTSGTVLLTDINPTGSSNPLELTVSGDNIYFTADNGVNGVELWCHGIYTTANCFAYFSTSYDSVLNTFTLTIDPVTVADANSFHWDFGDGSVSSLANPSHSYAANDIYNVCMTAYTSFGDSCRYCHNIGIDMSGDVVLRGGGFNLVTQNGVTGITTPAINYPALHLSPNPTEGVSCFSPNDVKGEVEIRVYDLSGQLVSQQKNATTHYVDLRGKPAGVYFIEINIDGELYRNKLIKR